MEVDGSYLLNSKDLCLLEHLHQLQEAGVESIKIEGRMKSLYYVANTTRVYREALREKADLTTLRQELDKISHRSYSQGFIAPQSQGEQNPQSSAYIRDYQFIGTVLEQTQNKVKIAIRAKFEVGDTIEFIFPAVEQDFCYLVQEIHDEKGRTVQKTNPNSTITLPLDKTIPSHGIIRKKL